MGVCVYGEWPRLLHAVQSPAGVLSWFTDWNSETTLPSMVLLSLPLLIRFGPLLGCGPKRRGTGKRNGRFLTAVSPGGTSSNIETPLSAGKKSSTGRFGYLLISASLMFCISLMASVSIGRRIIEVPELQRVALLPFMDLPPAYHDEFSYLLQARTFLAGRLSWPPTTVQPELFHQVHVLNHPRTASRYFPWTGLWIAPFESLGCAVAGHWLAGAVSCVFFYLSLTQLVNLRTAFFCGLLIAISPGLSVFSNLLLAHHPVLMALSIFLWAFLHYMKSFRSGYLPIAGVALTLAMLGRPMTAAGFALPFGIWFLNHVRKAVTASDASVSAVPLLRRPAVRLSIGNVILLGTPLLIGGAVLLIMNRSITGHWLSSAYQYYTDNWTPRHRYGFNNADRGALFARPDNVMAAYDEWAINLTPWVALSNVIGRMYASILWSFGLLPLAAGLLFAFPMTWFGNTEFGNTRFGNTDTRLKMLWWSILSLHAVHIPYWYDGIMHWHYVFETGPLLLMLGGIGLCGIPAVLRSWLSEKCSVVWVFLFACTAALPGWADADSLWGFSKVSMAVSEQSFSRIRMHQFRQLTNSEGVHHPCLVLVDERNSDPQLSYIVNPPDLNSDVLVCRLPADTSVLSELRQAFHDRRFYTFDPASGTMQPLDASPP